MDVKGNMYAAFNWNWGPDFDPQKISGRLKQIENQVENVSEKLDSLTASSQDERQLLVIAASLFR